MLAGLGTPDIANLAVAAGTFTLAGATVWLASKAGKQAKATALIAESSEAQLAVMREHVEALSEAKLRMPSQPKAADGTLTVRLRNAGWARAYLDPPRLVIEGSEMTGTIDGGDPGYTLMPREKCTLRFELGEERLMQVIESRSVGTLKLRYDDRGTRKLGPREFKRYLHPREPGTRWRSSRSRPE